MIIMSVVILSTNAISNSAFSRNKTQASRYTQEALEWLRSQRDINPDAFKIYANTGTYCLDGSVLGFSKPSACGSSEVITDTIFKRELYFSKEALVNGKIIINATIVSSWSDSKGYHEARSVTQFSDIRDR